MNKEHEDYFTSVQIHHIQSPLGESFTFKCPHCGKEIIILLKAMELDPDYVNVYWGKDWDEIEEKQKKLEEE